MYNGKRDWNEQHDKLLAVKIFKKAKLNKFKSEQENKQVFDDIEYVSIMAPGQRNQVTERPMTDKDRERFKFHYDNYLNREETKQNGIPLEMLPGITPGQTSTLRAIKVETIEQLAGLHEKAIKNLYEGRDLVKRAEKFIKGESYASELEKTIKALEKKIELLEGNKQLELEGENEPTNNNTKRNKRNTTRRRASNSSGE